MAGPFLRSEQRESDGRKWGREGKRPAKKGREKGERVWPYKNPKQAPPQSAARPPNKTPPPTSFFPPERERKGGHIGFLLCFFFSATLPRFPSASSSPPPPLFPTIPCLCWLEGPRGWGGEGSRYGLGQCLLIAGRRRKRRKPCGEKTDRKGRRRTGPRPCTLGFPLLSPSSKFLSPQLLRKIARPQLGSWKAEMVPLACFFPPFQKKGSWKKAPFVWGCTVCALSLQQRRRDAAAAATTSRRSKAMHPLPLLPFPPFYCLQCRRIGDGGGWIRNRFIPPPRSSCPNATPPTQSPPFPPLHTH